MMLGMLLQFLLLFGFNFPVSLPSMVTMETDRGEQVFFVEIADEPEEWSRGLMERSELSENSGMLFIFPSEQPQSFWMKNTLIPLDIIFADANGNVVDYFSMESCKIDPCRTYPSKKPAKYVLEVSKGMLQKIGAPRIIRLPWVHQ